MTPPCEVVTSHSPRGHFGQNMDILPGSKQLAPCHCPNSWPEYFVAIAHGPRSTRLAGVEADTGSFAVPGIRSTPGCQAPARPPLRLLALPPPIPFPGPRLLTQLNVRWVAVLPAPHPAVCGEGGACAVTLLRVKDPLTPRLVPQPLAGGRPASQLLCPPPGGQGRPGATPAGDRTGCLSFYPRQTRSGTLRMFGPEQCKMMRTPKGWAERCSAPLLPAR